MSKSVRERELMGTSDARQSGPGILPAHSAEDSPTGRDGFKFIAWSAMQHKLPKTELRYDTYAGSAQTTKSVSPEVQDVQNRTEKIALNSPPGPRQYSSEVRHDSKTAGNASRSRARSRRGTGKARRGQPLDPDYDRSFPPQQSKEGVEEPTNRTKRRLFDPNRDDFIVFQGWDKSAKQIQDDQPPSPDGKGVPEFRKEHRRDAKSHAVVPPEVRPIVIHQRPESGADPKGSFLGSPAPRPMAAPDTGDTNPEENDTLKMIKQPETRQISAEQLIAEVKGIYAGLIMVEAKCCEVDEKQHHAALETDGRQPPMLSNDQWQALIALHRTLLHEHHDFFLASQHPAASPSLKRLAQKYAMPARMWRHGIHSFLELLRHRLPHSLEHMLTFIYLAYSMMALLCETVPTFEDTWIECLGDLARYRMAIEDDDMKDREVWQDVARHWYTKAADKTPYVGRLYHHLAILARPNLLRQLFFYCKSLGVSQPFSSARESVLTVFDPIFNPDVYGTRSSPIDGSFIQLHSITFTHIEFERFDESLDSFLDALDKHISKPQSKFKVQGFYMAACNITALYQYGSRDSVLRKACKEGKKATWADEEMNETSEHASAAKGAGDAPEGNMEPLTVPPTSRSEGTRPRELLARAQDNEAHTAVSQTIQEISLNVSKRLGFRILSLTLERVDDSNVATHWHAWMVFLGHILTCPPAAQLLEDEFPWENLVDMLNHLRSKYEGDKIAKEDFPVPSQGAGRPLPEDYHIRGFDWARRYFPDGWFDNSLDNEDLDTEVSSMGPIREERILWLAMRICAADSVLAYDTEKRTFSVHEALKVRQEERVRMLVRATQKKDITMSTDEESDMEMTAAAYSNSEGEDYMMVVPEPIRKLQERKRQLEAQLTNGPIVTPEVLAEVTRAAIVKGPEALDHEYTAFVVDTNLLINHPETFALITNKGWSVIIPNCVRTELSGLGNNNSGSVGDAAKSAMIAINRVISEKKPVRIVTSKGSDITKAGLFKEKLDRNEDEPARNIDDVVINTAKDQAELRRQRYAGDEKAKANPDIEYCVLLTEDTNMRVKANARGIPAISTTMLKRYLVQLSKSKTIALKLSPSRTKRKSATAVIPRIRGSDDEDDDAMVVDVPKQTTRQRNHTNKRGKVEHQLSPAAR